MKVKEKYPLLLKLWNAYPLLLKLWNAMYKIDFVFGNITVFVETWNDVMLEVSSNTCYMNKHNAYKHVCTKVISLGAFEL